MGVAAGQGSLYPVRYIEGYLLILRNIIMVGNPSISIYGPFLGIAVFGGEGCPWRVLCRIGCKLIILSCRYLE